VNELSWIAATIFMRLLRFIFAVIFVGSFIMACSHFNKPRSDLEGTTLQQKLVGEWTGSIGTTQVLSWKTIIQSNGVWSTQNSTYDNSGHLLHFVQVDGRIVVTNRSVVCTITNSSDNDALLPRTLPREPIIRVDDHELVIITETGAESVSRKISQ
jgi:hypothetical protein